MIVYEGIKSEFLQCCVDDQIAMTIQKNVLQKMGRHTPQSEFKSWENSLNYMYKVLNDNQIPEECGIAIEYNIPQTAKRVDFIISGYDDANQENVIIIELKQWEHVQEVDSVDGLVQTFTGGANREVVHPSYQAWSYAQLIKDYNDRVQDLHIELSPCTCLHNYIRKEQDPLYALRYADYYKEAPIFVKGQATQLRTFIKNRIHKGDHKKILYEIENGRIRPSKSLQDSIASMLKGNPEFIMIDDQKVVYENILRISEMCQRDDQKRTIIVQGGPGTGKTVVAVNLLSELTQRDQFVQYVSKNSAPRSVYSKKLKGIMKKNSIDNLFKGSGTYHDLDRNAIHTLLVDEAHRLIEKAMYVKEGNQIREIIHSSLCSVFFIDESQRVTFDDIGSVEEIKKWAEKEKSEVFVYELSSQFRCNGSDGYLAWLDDVLDIRNTANYNLEGINFDFQVMDTPNEVYEKIVEKNAENNKSRMLAGYCWNWDKAHKNDSDYHDIKIGDFEMSWNLGSGEPFAISETSIHEIGCIHTSQGLEFDYAGVIIGDDLRYENDTIITDPSKRAKTDTSLSGYKKLFKENPALANSKADEIIKNTYRTLLTRGMKGCYVYCTDQALAAYLKDRMMQRT